MIRLQDIMTVEPINLLAVRPMNQPERSFRLGPLMDKVNRHSSHTTLLVTLAATHSGTIVNTRVYPGLAMRASQLHWMKPYAKPLLSNHPKRGAKPGDPQPEAYGRMRSAEFVQLVSDAQLADDWKKPGYRDQGSGFSKVQVAVTTPKAIEGILSQRLLTVSAGMDTNHLFCSACGSDWGKKGGRCDHQPGVAYHLEDSVNKDYAMYLITGLLFYDHLAFVNTPAQPYATVLSHQFMDSHQHDLFENGEVLDGRVLQLTLIDSQDGPMELLLEDSSKQDLTLSWTDKDWAEAFVLDSLASSGRIVDELLDEALPRIKAFRTSDRKLYFGKPRFAVGPKGSIRICDSRTAEAALDLVKRGFVKGADTKALESRILECVDSLVPINVGDSHMDPSKDWAEIVKMADGLEKVVDGKECDWSDFNGDLYDLAAQEGMDELNGVHAGIVPVADAVLTTKSRKQLPDSAFCGPNRSFPAHDAAHVRNALARLPQAKNFSPEQKSRILACVRRKAKGLGVEVGADQLEYGKLVEMLDKKVDDPGAKPPANETDAQKIRRLESQLESARGKITDQESTIQKLLDEQKNFQGELKKLYAKRLFDLRTELKKGDVLALDSAEKRQDFLTKLTLRTVASLRDSIQDLESESAPSGAGGDPRNGDQVVDPTATMQDADKGPKLQDGASKKIDDSKPEERFKQMLSGS